GSSVPGTYAGNRPVVLTLCQSGPRVRGQMTMGSQAEGPIGPIEGTVSGDILSFHDLRNRLTGRLQVSGDEMTGAGTNAGFPATVTLHRHPSPPASTSPPPWRPTHWASITVRPVADDRSIASISLWRRTARSKSTSNDPRPRKVSAARA